MRVSRFVSGGKKSNARTYRGCSANKTFNCVSLAKRDNFHTAVSVTFVRGQPANDYYTSLALARVVDEEREREQKNYYKIRKKIWRCAKRSVAKSERVT